MSVRYLYNTSGKYVAFLDNENVYDPNCEWLGFLLNGNEVYDPKGIFLGYILNDDRVAVNTSEWKPAVPPKFRPFKPFKPFRPFERLKMPPLPAPYKDVFEARPGAYAKSWSNTFRPSSRGFDSFVNSQLIAADGKFLGLVNKNPFDQNSLSNEFGMYGSQFQPYSIFNTFGQYGSEFSSLSPFNQFSTTPPHLWLNGSDLGALSVNQMILGRIDAREFVDWLKN